MPTRSVIELVGDIYAAATDETRWPAFLDNLAETLRSTTTTLYLQNVRDPKGSVAFAVRVDPPLIKQFDDHYSKVAVWGLHGAHLLTEGNVVTGEMVCPSSVVRKSEYSEYLKKMDVFHGYGAVIQRDGALASMLTSLRPERVGPYDEHEVEVLRHLMPHLQQAIQIHRRLARAQAAAAASLETLDRSALGVIVLDSRLRVVFSNRPAEAVLRAGDGLIQRSGELRARNSADSSALRQCLAAVAGAVTQSTEVPPARLLVRRASLKPSYVLMITPFPLASEMVPGLAAPGIAVYVHDPAAPVHIDRPLLRSLYQVTESEAEVAALLAAGCSVDAISRELGITVGTARWYLKRLFAKTATRSQADLVRVLLTASVRTGD